MKKTFCEYLPLEQKTKDEAEYCRKSWRKGCYNFLLQRTEEYYLYPKNFQRRAELIATINKELPLISDEILESLYRLASNRYLNYCNLVHKDSSGFQTTKSETVFIKSLEAILEDNPEFKYLEIYPSTKHSKNNIGHLKMVIGSYVPDFLVFGLKIKGSSVLTIEINGDSHVDKYRKDELRQNHLEELKIGTFSIENSQVRDVKYIKESIKKLYRKRSGALDKQIQRAKRMIWVKTISCHLSLKEIEEIVSEQYDIKLNLLSEAKGYLSHPECPRKIKYELMNLDLN